MMKILLQAATTTPATTSEISCAKTKLNSACSAAARVSARPANGGCAKVYGGPNGKADSLELQRGQVSSQCANTNWMVWGVVLDTCAERHGKA